MTRTEIGAIKTGWGHAFGLSKYEQLVKNLRKLMQEAEEDWKWTGKPARRFLDVRYHTRESWKRGRRVVGKTEYLDKGENPRFVVTSLSIEESDSKGSDTVGGPLCRLRTCFSKFIT